MKAAQATRLGIIRQGVQHDVHVELSGCSDGHALKAGCPEKMLKTFHAEEIQVMGWLDTLGLFPEYLGVESVDAQSGQQNRSTGTEQTVQGFRELERAVDVLDNLEAGYQVSLPCPGVSFLDARLQHGDASMTTDFRQRSAGLDSTHCYFGHGTSQLLGEDTVAGPHVDRYLWSRIVTHVMLADALSSGAVDHFPARLRGRRVELVGPEARGRTLAIVAVQRLGGRSRVRVEAPAARALYVSETVLDEGMERCIFSAARAVDTRERGGVEEDGDIFHANLEEAMEQRLRTNLGFFH